MIDIENKFDYLLSACLPADLPLKAFEREGEVEPRLVKQLRSKSMTMATFHKHIGFKQPSISANPLD